MKNQNLIKVILIKGVSHDVAETKEKVYQKYNHHFRLETIYIQHESEQCEKISMLSAHQIVMSFQELIESVRESISLQNIKIIVADVVHRVLSKENITKNCPNVDSSSDLKLIKCELTKKTIEQLESETSSELQRRMELNIKMKLGPVLCNFPIHRESTEVSETMHYIFLYLANIQFGLIRKLFDFALFPVTLNRNSSLWQADIVNEVYVATLNIREKIEEELLVHIKQRCEVTSDHLKAICEQLDNFRKRIDAIDQITREYLLKWSIVLLYILLLKVFSFC